MTDPEVQIAVELVGGMDWARQAVLSLLAAGKHVVTANKALLAEHGAEIFDGCPQARPGHRLRGGGVGGVPVIAVLSQGLAANQILSLQGILNGTCNFILTGMSEEGRHYRRGPGRGPETRLRRGRPDAGRGRHRRRPQAGDPRPDRLRRRRAVVRHRPPWHRRPAADGHRASPASWATRSSCWPKPGWSRPRSAMKARQDISPCTSRRCCCGIRHCWPRCAVLTTPSASSATPSATRCSMAAGPARCRRPAPWSPTSSTWRSAGRSGRLRRHALVRRGFRHRAAAVRGGAQPLLSAADWSWTASA